MKMSKERNSETYHPLQRRAQGTLSEAFLERVSKFISIKEKHTYGDLLASKSLKPGTK
jgi:hypothetical protein